MWIWNYFERSVTRPLCAHFQFRLRADSVRLHVKSIRICPGVLDKYDTILLMIEKHANSVEVLARKKRSIGTCLSISNCSQCNSSWKPTCIRVRHYPCREKFKYLWVRRRSKCSNLWWWLRGKSMCCLSETGLRNWTWVGPPTSRCVDQVPAVKGILS